MMKLVDALMLVIRASQLLNKTLYHNFVLAALLLGSSACTMGPDFVRPKLDLPERYTLELLPKQTIKAESISQHFVQVNQVSTDWWALFQSPTLNQIITKSLENNPTLKASVARLRQSQDNLLAGDGVFYPQLDLGLSAKRQRTAPIQQGLKTSGSVFNLLNLNGSINYVVDIFGAEKRRVEGLAAEVDHQDFLNKAAYLMLTANIVNTVIARAAYTAEYQTTENIIALQRQQLVIANIQVKTGLSPYSDLLTIQSLIASNKASLSPLKQKISQANHLLLTLGGDFPSSSAIPDIHLLELALPSDIPVSLPSKLLQERPDIGAAEAELHIASANVGIATASLFPSFSVTGNMGSAATNFGNFVGSGSTFWSFGPSISVPVFHGGTLRYQRQAAIDAYQESEENYRQTVLTAFAQVADSLNALQNDAEQLLELESARNNAKEELQLAQANYKAGLVGYINVLVANIQYQTASIAYLQTVAQRHQDTVSLFVALGGGWWNSTKNDQVKRENP